MQRIFTKLIVLSVLGSAGSAWAVDDLAAGSVSPQTTIAEAPKVEKEGRLKEEVIGFKPQFGMVAFKDQLGRTTSRMAGGAMLEGNLAPLLGIDQTEKRWYTGFATGFIYSHLGEPTSNFIGTNPDVVVGSGGANLVIIPTNLKVGYNFSDSFRLSLHGGGNVFYRSVRDSLRLGPNNSTGTDDTWTYFPNVGADAEFGLGKNVALMLRPDFTLTPGDAFFTGTVAVGIPLG